MKTKKKINLALKPWFSRGALNMVDHSLHDREEDAQRSQDTFINQLVLFLLDAERADPEFLYAPVLSFYSFCQRNIRQTNAQILQDLWVLYMLGEKRNGYFVEFGACDGHSLSNTLLLEEGYGWRGLLAEPNPIWHEALRKNRTADISTQCVAATSGQTVDFISTYKIPELSRMANVVPEDIHEKNGNRDAQSLIQVETTSLLDLLRSHDAPEEIDYLSIDTEGSEFEILRNFDFDAYRFRLVTVEHAGEKEKRENIKVLLEANGYHRWLPALTRWDDWYVWDSGNS